MAPQDSPPGLRLQPQQPRAHAKIQRILDATAQLLLSEDVGGLPLAAIARAADMPPPTVYRYFPDKLAILAALAERAMARVDSAAEQALQDMLASRKGNPDWAGIIRLIYELYRAEAGYVPVLRAAGASQALREIASRSNERMALQLVGLLQNTIDLPKERLLRIARLLTEAAQAHFELALLTSDTGEADAIVHESGQMLDALYRHYRSQHGRPE